MILSKSAFIINERAKSDLLLTSVTFTIAVCNAILIL